MDEQIVDDSASISGSLAATVGSNGIKFIEEEDGGSFTDELKGLCEGA